MDDKVVSMQDKILHITNTLIQKNGFKGFSYADFADRLQIKKASIHYYYPSKDDLGIAYCDKKMHEFEELHDTIVKASAGSEQLTLYLSSFETCVVDDEMCGVYAMLSDLGLFSEPLREAVNKVYLYEIEIIKGILKRGQDEQQFAFEMSIEEMAMIIFSIVKGGILLNRLPKHDAYQMAVDAIRNILHVRDY